MCWVREMVWWSNAGLEEGLGYNKGGMPNKRGSEAWRERRGGDVVEGGSRETWRFAIKGKKRKMKVLKIFLQLNF